MARHGEKASAEVGKALHEAKESKLKSGGSGKTVKSRRQAIAIGLSKARKAGGKVPPEPERSRAVLSCLARARARRGRAGGPRPARS